jgi:hypothetical protein
VPGDDVIGYISLGRGITVHRRDCPNVRALWRRITERFTPVYWDTQAKGPLRVEIQVEAYDRNHLLEDISRTLSESGVGIVAAHIFTARNNMVKDRFVFDVSDIDFLETLLQRIKADRHRVRRLSGDATLRPPQRGLRRQRAARTLVQLLAVGRPPWRPVRRRCCSDKDRLYVYALPPWALFRPTVT